jgi:transposase
MVFGPQTEKWEAAEQNNQGEKAGDPERMPEDAQQQKRKGGHGRNKASAYSGAKKVECRNGELKAGDGCPQEGCLGRLYDLNDPVILVQFRGQPPITATNYEREVLRCAKCQERYTAPLPEGVTNERYTPSADATIAIMKFASGQPWYRQARLQKMSGVPLPESVQWERCEVITNASLPVYLQLEKLGGNGELFYLDGTPVTILDWEKVKKRLPENDRKGTQTSVIIVEVGGHKIALYLCGRKHAGENLEALLAKRCADLGLPIQMSDALAVNGSGTQPTIQAKCLVHARRKFYNLREIFPVPVKFVLDAIGKVYEYEAQTKGMTREDRLKHHQERSGPVLSELKEWMEKQLANHEVEPNSGLGEAIRYSLKHWSSLTQFLSTAGAPLDNNTAERGVKQFVLFRKNSLFYKNEHGAAVGSILTSLIETCRLNGVNPWDYLIYLRKTTAEVRKNPEIYLPWNYANSQAEPRVA